MPDLLTHVLVAYVVATLFASHTGVVKSRHVPLAMVGGALPDLSKLYLVVDPQIIANAAGIPFSWQAAHTVGVVVVLSVAGTLLFVPSERQAVFGVLSTGWGLHFALDSFIIRASGLVPPYLYPVTWWQYPSGDVYLSSTRWPSIVAITLAVLVYVSGRRTNSTSA